MILTLLTYLLLKIAGKFLEDRRIGMMRQQLQQSSRVGQISLKKKSMSAMPKRIDDVFYGRQVYRVLISGFG